jgi:hypothetical protein
MRGEGGGGGDGERNDGGEAMEERVRRLAT